MELAQSICVASVLLALGACAGGNVPDHSIADAGTTADHATGPSDAASPNPLTIVPGLVTISPGATQTFVAMLNGAPTTMINWSVVEPTGGSVNPSGTYQAPSTSGRYHLLATSQSTPTLTASATIQVSMGTASWLPMNTWTNITPNVDLTQSPGGVISMAVDTSHPSTIYVGMEKFGVWRSDDFGATWSALGDPANGVQDWDDSNPTGFLDVPISLAVDPSDSMHLYATQGVRGTQNDFFVTHDGGRTWISPAGFRSVAPSGDVTTMAIDPTDFRHVLLGSHTQDPVGVLESTDGGDSWTIHPPPANGGWAGGTYGINFLYDPISGRGDARTWLVHNEYIWRTTDAGTTWTNVFHLSAVHGGTEANYTAEGVVYSGGFPNPARSRDNGLTWEGISGLAGSGYFTIAGDGHSLYLQPDGKPSNSPVLTSLETDGVTWVPSVPADPHPSRGPLQFRFDRTNGILYSVNWSGGLWALRTGH